MGRSALRWCSELSTRVSVDWGSGGFTTESIFLGGVVIAITESLYDGVAAAIG